MSSEGHVQRQSFSAQMREVIRKRSESLVRDHERRFADVGRLVAETGRDISAIGEDEAGEAYATDLSSGELLRIVATGN